MMTTMKTLIRVFLFYVSVDIVLVSSQDVDETQREGKFLLSPINLVRFNNDKCFNTVGESGTCYTKFDCMSRGGTPMGLCAAGFGVCCQFNAACGNVVSTNNTYIKSPSTLGTGVGVCEIVIRNTYSSVCQVRIDFEELTLNIPNAAGVCDTDTLTIIGSTNVVPTICGENAGQHMYAHIGQTSRDITVRIRSTTTFDRRKFKLLVSFIPCDCNFHAPEGCLQYHTGLTVTNIKSFNWIRFKMGQHLANQDYEICFRTEYDQCGICFNECFLEEESGSFSIEGATTTLHLNSQAQHATNPTQPCSNDYVYIECGNRKGREFKGCNADRYCGTLLNPRTSTTSMPNIPEKVCTYRQPLRIRFKTDATEMTPNPAAANGNVADVNTSGFCLNAEQVNCYARK